MKHFKFISFLLTVSILIMLAGCKHDCTEIVEPDPGPSPGPETHVCDPDTVYFEKDLLPILASSCATSGCHDATATEDIRLDSYAAVMASGIVTPYDPDESEMYEVIIETDSSDRMPPPPALYLPQEQIQLVYKWIEQGAQNLFCDEDCDTVNVTFSETIWQGIIQKHCFGCHNGASASGGIFLEDYQDVKAAAEIPAGQYGSLMGTVTHSQGNSAMPKNQDQLSACKITQLTKWIENGTPNN